MIPSSNATLMVIRRVLMVGSVIVAKFSHVGWVVCRLLMHVFLLEARSVEGLECGYVSVFFGLWKRTIMLIDL